MRCPLPPCHPRLTSQPSPLCPHPTGIRAYEQLGFRAFGTPGKLAAAIAITLQNIGGEREGWDVEGTRGYVAAPTTLPSSARSHVQLPVHCQV